jgi:hypothetical protein
MEDGTIGMLLAPAELSGRTLGRVHQGMSLDNYRRAVWEAAWRANHPSEQERTVAWTRTGTS